MIGSRPKVGRLGIAKVGGFGCTALAFA